MVDAYYFCVGGGVGKLAAIARPVGYRCRSGEVPDAITRLLEEFQSERAPEENLQKFLSRHSNEDIRNILAGAVVDAAQRDLSAGPVPHGVEG